MILPYSTQLQEQEKAFENGNFSLWFNKLIPLNKDCKACGSNDNDKNTADFYKQKYDKLKNNKFLKKRLNKKHDDQVCFCQSCKNGGYDLIEIRAELTSPLITGIGQIHPSEVGMVFDHTMGIPYIPASSIKGIVRLGHILNLIKDGGSFIENDMLDEADRETKIPDIFGGDLTEIVGDIKVNKKLKGKVLFLDAYSENVPELHIDIMNPHYGDYYSDDNEKTPPADYLDPNPIKFLTVKRGTVFVFRSMVSGDHELKILVNNAFNQALIEEGVGAKTAVGYGRFKILDNLSQGQTKLEPAKRETSKQRAKESQTRSSEKPNPKVKPAKQVWENVILTFNPGK